MPHWLEGGPGMAEGYDNSSRSIIEMLGKRINLREDTDTLGSHKEYILSSTFSTVNH